MKRRLIFSLAWVALLCLVSWIVLQTTKTPTQYVTTPAGSTLPKDNVDRKALAEEVTTPPKATPPASSVTPKNERELWAACRRLPTFKEQSICERKLFDQLGYTERFRAQQKKLEREANGGEVRH